MYLLFSTVLFQTESHTEPGTYGCRKISCTASPRDLHALPPHHWDYRHVTMPGFFELSIFVYNEI